jgi:hypothetical protein
MTDGKMRQGTAHNICPIFLSFVFNGLECFLRKFDQEYFSCHAALQKALTPISCVQPLPTLHPQLYSQRKP